MDTVEVVLAVPDLEHDRYIGLLEERATGFRQTDARLIAYVPTEEWSEAARERLAARLLSDRNWNEVWERSIAPVRVDPFLLCGPSPDAPTDRADLTRLRIDPKMSFGTGHHATTRLALRLLVDAVDDGDQVVDVGTGTGVLAIAACRLGARSVLAVDTDPNAVTNARENVAMNDVGDCVRVRPGSVEAVPEQPVDVLVANVTRDPLLDLLPACRARLAPEGTLILSGLLTSDQDQMRAALAEHNLSPTEEVTENGWWALRCRPAGPTDA